jgi:hypothetical protein
MGKDEDVGHRIDAGQLAQAGCIGGTQHPDGHTVRGGSVFMRR